MWLSLGYMWVGEKLLAPMHRTFPDSKTVSDVVFSVGPTLHSLLAAVRQSQKVAEGHELCEPCFRRLFAPNLLM